MMSRVVLNATLTEVQLILHVWKWCARTTDWGREKKKNNTYGSFTGPKTVRQSLVTNKNLIESENNLSRRL